MSWTVYILECVDGTYYTGISSNVEKRIDRHENGKGARYTKTRAPLKLIYTEECEDRSSATRRELYIKSLRKKEKISLVKGEII